MSPKSNIQGSSKLNMMSQIMKIDEFSPGDEGITNAPAQVNKVPQMMKR